MKTHLVWSSLLLVLVFAGCRDRAATSAKPLVVATFYPLYEFAREVARDRADVVSLVPPGVEPHDWEPSPQDILTIQKARLFIYNGAGLEPWVDKLRGTIGRNGPHQVKATAGLTLITAPVARSVRDPGEISHPPDPHVWLDPLLAQSMVETIRKSLIAVDPPNAAAYSEHTAAYRAKLQALHEAFEHGLRECARREIVVSHAAFSYLVTRYRLSQVAVGGLAPESEPSPAQLAALASYARRAKVTHIFSETLVSPRLADTLAREVGAHTLVLLTSQ